MVDAELRIIIEQLLSTVTTFVENTGEKLQTLENQIAELNATIYGSTRDSEEGGGGTEEPNIQCGGGGGGGGGVEDEWMIPMIKFPTYDGTTDPLGWLKRCERYFIMEKTPEERKIAMAAFHLIDEAQLWFDEEEQGMIADWEQFKEIIEFRFGPSICENRIGDLVNLRQIGSVSEYTSEFQRLVARAPGLSVEDKIGFYINGLKEDLRMGVELAKPSSLAIAMNMARTLERKRKFMKD